MPTARWVDAQDLYLKLVWLWTRV